jgi:hypothetical protein
MIYRRWRLSTTTQALRLLSMSALLALASAAQAQDFIDHARRVLSEVLSKGKPGVLPVPAPQALDDNWGGPGAGARQPPKADERQRDERGRDERGRDERGRDERAPAPASNALQRRPGARPVGRATAATPAVCTNVARAWSGAETFVRRGETQRAYDAYLRLLSTCAQPQELTGTAWKARTTLPLPLLEQLADEPVLNAPEMDEPRFILASGIAVARAENGDTATGARIARSLRKLAERFKDAAFLETGGWLELADNQAAAAESWFQAALRLDPARTAAAEGLVQAYLSQRKLALARAAAARLRTDNAAVLQAQVRLAQAADALARKQPRAALELLGHTDDLPADDAVRADEVRAWALLSLHRDEEAAALFERLSDSKPEDPKLAEGYVEALRRLRRTSALESLAGQAGPVAVQAAHAHAQLVAGSGRRLLAGRMRGDHVEGYGPDVTAVAGVRAKSGVPGEGRLNIAITPEASARTTVGQTTFAADAARMSVSDGLRMARGGAYGMTVVHEGRLSAVLRATGLSLGGTARSGIAGTVRWYDNGATVEGTVAAEPVADSLRSLIGVIDGGTVVGSATRYSLHAAGGHPLGALADIRWLARTGVVTGKSIPANPFYELHAGLPISLQSSAFSWVSVGPELTLASYRDDQNRYAGAYGGYFSPLSDFGLGVRANAMTPENRDFLLKATGYAGLSHRKWHYGAVDGVAYEGSLQWARLLGAGLIWQLGASVRNAPGYSDVALWAGVTYAFERRTGLYASDLRELRLQ